MTFDFLIQSVEQNLSRLKPRDFYSQRIAELEINMSTLDQYHLLNVSRLHLDEFDILKGNLDYLRKARDSNIKEFY
jgi:hypothetical protein